MFFHSSVAPKARKVGSEKRGGAEAWLRKMSAKFAPRCGARAISANKTAPPCMFGALLEVELRKICITPWRESDLEFKIVKTFWFGALLEVELRKICTTLWCENDLEVKFF